MVAFRPGEIGDETESEGEEDEDDTDADDGSASGLLFWLGVVVKTFTIAGRMWRWVLLTYKRVTRTW